MHIVIDARFLRRTTGGIGRYTQALIAGLASLTKDDRFTVVITPADRADWDELKKTAKLSAGQWQVRVVEIPHYSLAEQTRLPRILADLKPDLVHFTNFNHPMTYAGPMVVTIHDLTILKYPAGARQRSPIFQWGFRQVLRHARHATRIIADSAATKRDLIDVLRVQPEKVTTIYLGVDPTYQPINLPQRGRLHTYLNETYGIRPPYLLFVSQWRPHKGIDVLLEAYEKLRQTGKIKPKLVLVGRPHPAYPEIAAHVSRHPFAADIIRPGFVAETDLPKLYQGAELFIFPSLYEGFGLPALEAMAAGVPVVATSAASIPEIVGDAARLVAPGDALALAAAMGELLGNQVELRRLRAAGLAQARKFSWRRMAEETLGVYHDAFRRS